MELRDVAGFPDYKVSNDGRVWSGITRKWLKLRYDRCGYVYVALIRDGKQVFKSIHRLVAEAFIPNPSGLAEVNHIDEDKTNNAVYNLEWCDHKYNCNYGTRIQRFSESMRNSTVKQTNQSRYGKPVVQYKDGVKIASYPAIKEAARCVGVKPQSIIAALNGKTRTCAGCVWRYAD